MATLMEELVGAVDAARQCATDVGWFMRNVVCVRRTWPGSAVGEGLIANRTEADAFTITPRPRVRDANLVEVHEMAGMLRDGSLYVDEISATYTDAQMRGTGLATNVEQLWRVEKVADDIEALVKDDSTGLFTVGWVWRRNHPLGWAMLLHPARA